jgi:hypothetical protein
MASSNHFENATTSQMRMTDHPEWKRMVQEIVELRQVNAELAEKMTTLEMQLEAFSKDESRKVECVSPAI